MTNIFQTPWLLLSISLVLLIVVTVVRQNSPEKTLWWLLLLPLILGVVAFGLDYFIKTDYEKVKHTIKCTRNAIVAEDTDALAKTLSGLDDQAGLLQSGGPSGTGLNQQIRVGEELLLGRELAAVRACWPARSLGSCRSGADSNRRLPGSLIDR